MTRYVCSGCGLVVERDRDSDARNCPECDPMRWMHRIRDAAACCSYVTPPQSRALRALGIPDTGAGQQICANAPVVDGLCRYHHELEQPPPPAAVAAEPEQLALI